MKYHIITYGCQMNKNDSERVASFLDENGLQETEEKSANIVIVNSCSIRQSAVDRIREKVKSLKKEKVTLIVTGCLLDKDKKEIEDLADFVLPLNDLPSWPLPFLEKKKNFDYFQIDPKRKGSSAYISIMTGCENFCAYCVVPYTKGKEISRPANEIIAEAERVVKDGYKEIWVLGQNVNSFAGGISFPDLLREINKIRGNFWIRFTSSHPKDFSDDLISAMKDCKKVTKYLNLPVQSGDNEILKKMNRPYTIEYFKELIRKTKESIPEITLSTDVIVGFPGEREKHFHNTVKLFNEIDFDMIYIGRYSPRFQTASYNMKETVTENEKRRREKIITEILKEKNLEKNKRYKGKKLKVLVSGVNRKGLLIGKTEDYKNVIFEGPKKLIGDFTKVEITNCSSWGLKGKISQK